MDDHTPRCRTVVEETKFKLNYMRFGSQAIGERFKLKLHLNDSSFKVSKFYIELTFEPLHQNKTRCNFKTVTLYPFCITVPINL